MKTDLNQSLVSLLPDKDVLRWLVFASYTCSCMAGNHLPRAVTTNSQINLVHIIKAYVDPSKIAIEWRLIENMSYNFNAATAKWILSGEAQQSKS